MIKDATLDETKPMVAKKANKLRLWKNYPTTTMGIDQEEGRECRRKQGEGSE
ncbi:UNVERIFIED_CONTAM: hypothetical protein Sradi_7105900 [Sesamum radiatum]|uniref:Uncharacterized protein n=1 Tax=Sesamum radiatum TaxID=300843 RepID=A0AAW2J3F5_SESRA